MWQARGHRFVSPSLVRCLVLERDLPRSPGGPVRLGTASPAAWKLISAQEGSLRRHLLPSPCREQHGSARSALSSRRAYAPSGAGARSPAISRQPCALADMPQLLRSSYKLRNEAPYCSQLTQQAGCCTAGARSSLRLAARVRCLVLERDLPRSPAAYAPWQACLSCWQAHSSSGTKPSSAHSSLNIQGGARQMRARHGRCAARVRASVRAGGGATRSRPPRRAVRPGPSG